MRYEAQNCRMPENLHLLDPSAEKATPSAGLYKRREDCGDVVGRLAVCQDIRDIELVQGRNYETDLLFSRRVFERAETAGK